MATKQNSDNCHYRIAFFVLTDSTNDKSSEEEKILELLESLKEHQKSSLQLKDEEKRRKILSSMEEAKMHLLFKLSTIQSSKLTEENVDVKQKKCLEKKFLTVVEVKPNVDGKETQQQLNFPKNNDEMPLKGSNKHVDEGLINREERSSVSESKQNMHLKRKLE